MVDEHWFAHPGGGDQQTDKGLTDHGRTSASRRAP
jgi:hypothetical protein